MAAEEFEERVRATCAQAGLEAMAGILVIVRDRENVDEQALLELAPEQVTDLYDSFVGPAVDAVEDDLLGEQGGEEGEDDG